MPSKPIAPEHAVEDLSILDEVGQADAALEPTLDDEALLRVYRAMVVTRKLDERMIKMQRQGEMGTFAPGRGQEATQIGQVYPLKEGDWFSPSYRSFGAQIWRGWPIEQLLLLWDGYFEGFAPPEGVNDLPFSIVIGSHVPMAVGVAMGLQYRESSSVMLTNFGDGASSEGDVSEALNFAAVYKAPVVFVCENNGYAISTPVTQQTAVTSLAHRAPAFGMPGIRVDGNDVLAMIAATQKAVDRARAGDGPTLIEAVTFRMEMHTTADDPTVYRNNGQVAAWQNKDPITRFEKYILAKGVMDERAVTEISAEAEEQVRSARGRFRDRAIPNPRDAFDFVYTELTPELEEQRTGYLRKLDALVGDKTPKPV